MRRLALLIIVLFAGCTTDVPIAQNTITFHLVKLVGSATHDSLQPIYPNPFNRVIGDTALNIQFVLYDSGAAIVLVQNPIGDAIAQWSDSTLAAGAYAASWQPLANDGSRLKAGLYFVSLHTKNYIDSRLVNIQENE